MSNRKISFDYSNIWRIHEIKYFCTCGYNTRTAMLMRNHTKECEEAEIILKEKGMEGFYNEKDEFS